MRHRRPSPLAALAAVAVASLAVAPPVPGDAEARPSRVGLLMSTSPAAAGHVAAAFSQGLRELGRVEGRDVVLEYRWAEGRPERFPDLAGELARAGVDVIVASSIAAAEAARKATATIPIVMVNAADPVGAGLVASLGQPGGNVTGLAAQMTPEIRAKQLQILAEALPKLASVTILRRRDVAASPVWKDYVSAGQGLGLRVQFADIAEPDELERAFGALSRQRPGALLVPGDPVFFSMRRRLVDLAVGHRLPGMFSTREYTEAGGLLSYSARLTDQFRRAARYVHRILAGANPATLPVEHPTEYELVVNRRTARALGIALPPALLIRADEVID
jgi:putative ABC transport system substrate-binding protein